MWGATSGREIISGSLTISIHAPRVGRDRMSLSSSGIFWAFQSTRPVWGATWYLCTRWKRSVFQSTRPVWGATVKTEWSDFIVTISIHAPRVGRDFPVSPARHKTLRFQSTRPVWGATYMPDMSQPGAVKFQSTRPVWGATLWPRVVKIGD